MKASELAMVAAKYGVSADVAKRNLDSVQPDKPNEPATDIRSTAKERGRANLLDGDSGSAAQLERDFGHGALGQIQLQARLGQKFRVVITSFRRRLLDEDNLCEKYLVDLCRYIGVLPKDSPGTATITVQQEKISSDEEEKCKIEIYRV